MFKNKQWLQAIGQAIIAALTALLTALSASSCSPGLADAVRTALENGSLIAMI